MTPQMQAVFEPLSQKLQTRVFTDIDLLELIGEFAGNNPPVAVALAFHARDILTEHDKADTHTEYTQVVIETYRRTFFDADAAALYGTQHIPQQGPEALGELSKYLIHCLDADDAQETAGCFVPASTDTH